MSTPLRSVRLNHAQMPGRVPAIARLVLAGGALAMCLALYVLRDLQVEKARLLAERSQLQQPVATFTKRLSPLEMSQKNAERAEMQSVVTQLQQPWEPLFSMLENMPGKGIRMVSIEPNAGKHALKLTAQAASLDIMLAYLDRLSQQQLLRDVFLVSHEQANDGRALPFNFVVEAVWQN